MTADQQREQQVVDHFILADDDAANLAADRVDAIAEGIDQRGDIAFARSALAQRALRGVLDSGVVHQVRSSIICNSNACAGL